MSLYLEVLMGNHLQMVDFELPCQMVYLHDIQSVALLAEDSTPVIFVAETSALAMGNIGKAHSWPQPKALD